jgi:hypothetical protein
VLNSAQMKRFVSRWVEIAGRRAFSQLNFMF